MGHQASSATRDAPAVVEDDVANDEGIDVLALTDQGRSMSLPSGRVVECRSEGADRDAITVRGAGGAVELEVILTPAGPVLRFRAAAIELEAAGKLRLDCEDLELHARRDASVRVGGDFVTEAQTTTIRSERGDVLVEANDDVVLHGERVKLNC
jgi:hypothetical protein